MLGRLLIGITGLLMLAACAGRHDTSAPTRPAGAILLAREQMRHEPRNIVVCEEYLAQVAKEGQRGAAPSTKRDIRALWLDKRPMPPTPANCDEALDNYDFDRAAGMIGEIQPPVTGSGPYLVAYLHGKPRLVVDTDTADTDEKLRAAVADYFAYNGNLAPDRAVAAAAKGTAPPRQKRSLCDRMAGVNINPDTSSAGVFFAELAGVLVAEAVICTISAIHERPPA